MHKNYFEWFELPENYTINDMALLAVYQRLQQQYHPDRFIGSGADSKRLCTQISSLINDAYQTLKNPLKRAVYLLKLKGVDVGLETDTQFSRDFLLDQLEWQETIERLQQSPNAEKREEKMRELNASIQSHESAIRSAFERSDLSAARDWTRRLQFFVHLGEQIRVL